jgi:NADPH:quinone reductase
MRALVFSAFGPPADRLRLATVPDPEGEAVVEILAASINPSDVKNVEGRMEGTTLPRIPGRDFAGRVLSGPREWIGAEIWGTGGDIGFTRDGTHAERLALPVSALVRKPRSLSFEQAASIGVTFSVAWIGLIEYARVAAGETVLVLGAGGGVGNAVGQLARAAGARTIGADRHPLPPGSPFDETIPPGADLPAATRDLTRGHGAAIVFDTVGGVLFETALACAAPRGRVVQISATGRPRVEFNLLDFYHNETVLIGADSRKRSVIDSAPFMARLAQGFDAGHYQPPAIAARYKLDRAHEAYAAVAEGSHQGRIVLLPNS